jgi:hypothetical protein
MSFFSRISARFAAKQPRQPSAAEILRDAEHARRRLFDDRPNLSAIWQRAKPEPAVVVADPVEPAPAPTKIIKQPKPPKPRPQPSNQPLLYCYGGAHQAALDITDEFTQDPATAQWRADQRKTWR